MEKRIVGQQKNAPSKQTYDVDTSNVILAEAINSYNLYGRKNIVINASVEDFYANPLKVIGDNLGTILSIHNQNVKEMEYLMDFEKGKQDILNKTRPNGDSKINNKNVSNYAWEFVNFKKGYYVGKPIKYVDLNEEKYEDIKYLNRYNRNIRKSSKDLIKYENMLITGVAYTMTIPSKKDDLDIEYESPYTYTVLDNSSVCVVKSNDIYKTKLFSMCISDIQLEDENKTIKEYTVYYGKNYLSIRKYGDVLELVEEGVMPVYDCITEYQLNEQRMGVFEPILSQLNSLNTITSNQLDQQEESINSYLTFENVDIEEVIKNIDTFRQKRILAVNTANPETPAKIGSISINSDHSSINEKYNNLEQRIYDIIGVPMPTSSTGQGVSGEAQLYGGGWENAQTIASVDTQYILQFEEEDLEKFIYISKDMVNTKTPNLIPSNIEIKYTINKSNNMMTKAQSMTYFLDKGFTREQALTFCEITDDPQSEGQVADNNVEEQKIRDLEFELEATKRRNELSVNEENNQE